MSDNSNMTRWVEQETVNFSSRVWELRTRRYYHPARRDSDDYYIASPDWVVVVARTIDHKILFVRQFRWGIDDFSLELPAASLIPMKAEAAESVSFPKRQGMRQFLSVLASVYPIRLC